MTVLSAHSDLFCSGPTMGGGEEIPGKSPPYLGFSWGKAGQGNPKDFPGIYLGIPQISRVYLGKPHILLMRISLAPVGKSHDFLRFSPGSPQEMISLRFPWGFPSLYCCTADLGGQGALTSMAAPDYSCVGIPVFQGTRKENYRVEYHQSITQFHAKFIIPFKTHK